MIGEIFRDSGRSLESLPRRGKFTLSAAEVVLPTELKKVPRLFLTAALLLMVGAVVSVFGITLWPVSRDSLSDGLNFEALDPDLGAIQQAQEATYRARDGADIFYRQFGDSSNDYLVLIHGSGSEGRYLASLANAISRDDLATAIVPDLRGHGRSPAAIGDIDYLGQYEDDLDDLIAHLRRRSPNANIVLAGHSSGGGLVIRWAGGDTSESVQAYLLLAPYLGRDSPTVRPQSGGWVQVSVRRYIGLGILNGFGIDWLNGLPVLFFNRPDEWNDEFQAESYSFRLNESLAPRAGLADLTRMSQPALVVVGADDESFYAEEFVEVFGQFDATATVEVVPDAMHLNLPDSSAARSTIFAWLADVYAR